jgi:6-hydroxycyclohex-1-ene-1-carbonyl-CoA dehydrogenase
MVDRSQKEVWRLTPWLVIALLLGNFVLMAFDARAVGVWGCPPELYPAALAQIENGSVRIEPFVETRPMSQINEALVDIKNGRAERRVVLIADF